MKNFFVDGIEDNKAIIAYCIPGTKIVGYYEMNEICKFSTIEGEYYQERTLSNDWNFSKYIRTVTTP